MNNKAIAIQDAFQGKLVGRRAMKQHVGEVLSRMPEEIIRFVTDTVWFVTSFDDAWAFTFTGSDFENKHVIFLSDDLLAQDISQIYWTIAHEIGHVVLGHKNRFSEKFNKKRVTDQERQADTFAQQYVESVNLFYRRNKK
jgi:Zn-dependent peptidase ImmA (M78 family)